MVVYTSTCYAKPRYTAVKENLGTCKNKSGQGDSVSKKGEQIKSEKAIRNPTMRALRSNQWFFRIGIIEAEDGLFVAKSTSNLKISQW